MIDLGLLLAVPILFLVGIRRPDRLLLLWLLLTPLAYDTIFFGHNLRVVSFDRLVLLASVSSLLVNGQLGYLFPKRLSKLEKATVAFIVIFMLEALVSFPVRDAFSIWTDAVDRFIIPFYLYLLTKYLLLRKGTYDEKLESRIAVTIGIVGFYCAVMAVFEGITHIDLLPRVPDGLRLGEDGDRPRANGPFGVAGILGEYMSLILLFSLYRWRALRAAGLRTWSIGRAFTVPYTLLLLAGLFSTMFRNLWLGFLGGYSIRYLVTRKGRGLFLLGFVFVAMVAATFWDKFTQTGIYQERISNVENLHDRLNAWLYAFRAFSEHPLVGIGYGQLQRYISRAQERGDDLRIFEEVPATIHPHNTLIAMIGENGLLLAIPFLLMLVYLLGHVRACVRLARSEQDIAFGLFAVGGAFAMLAPHMTDRCLQWNKYNILLFFFIALVVAHHSKLTEKNLAAGESTDAPAHEGSQATPA